MASTKSIVVIGSGPGIGVGVAAHFASKGFNKVALVSRNADRLEREDAAFVKKAAPSVEIKTYTFDAADHEGALDLLDRIEKDIGVPEVLVYNAAHLTKSELGVYSAKDVGIDLQISTLTLYNIANWVLPKMAAMASSDATSKPSLLVTSGGLYQNPFHPYFSLAVSKAAQHNLAMNLNQAYSEKGVHVAAVVVNGFVGPDSELFNPARIATFYWDLYEQGAKGEKSVWITAEEEDESTKRWKAAQKQTL